MSKQIAILRGINVGGKRKILMADLRALFEQMNFSEVKTYIQSGNVFFNTAEKIEQRLLEQKIATAIEKEFGFEVPVIVRTAEEIKNLGKCNDTELEDSLETIGIESSIDKSPARN